jgi:nucleoside-diphosphate-sugar epimerase
MSRILITGGAGFLGSALARHLVETGGHEVGVFDDFSRGRRHRLPGSCNIFEGDIRDREAVMCAVFDHDVILHLAYVQGTQTFYEDPRYVIDVALNGIVNVLHGCEMALSRKELFLVSSSEVYQVPPEGMVPTGETVPLSVPDVTNPRYSYGAGKIASEVAALAYSNVLARTVIVRPHNLYGPDAGHEHVIPQLAVKAQQPDDELLIQGSGFETRSFCHVDDCATAFGVLLESGEDRGVYHVGNPEEVTIHQLATMILEYYGRRMRIVPSELPKGSPARRCPDISRMLELGWRPCVSLADGLPDTLAWYDRNRVPA